MIRAMDRFYVKHPRISLAIAIMAAFLTLYFAAPSLVERVEQPINRSST